jgi:hypothetical protein
MTDTFYIIAVSDNGLVYGRRVKDRMAVQMVECEGDGADENYGTGNVAKARAAKDVLGAIMPDEGDELTMLGAEVHWFPGDDDGPPKYDESDPPGWVAFARMSDGTLSFPMGSTIHERPEEAAQDLDKIRYEDGNVFVKRGDNSDDQAE